MSKVSVISLAMLAGALAGYVGCRLLLGFDPWVANAIGLGTSAGVAFTLGRLRAAR